MCWFIHVNIALIDGIKRFDESLLEQIDPKYQFEGTFPDYTLLLDDSCLCALFDEKHERDSLFELLKNVLQLPQTKKITIQKFWTELKPHKDLKSISLDELKNNILCNEIEEDVAYKLIDETKYKYN